MIGLWPTLAIVVVTAVIGLWLVRSRGFGLSRLRRSFERLSDPTEPLAHGAMILFSGALLLTPGFFTDALGLRFWCPPSARLSLLGQVRARGRECELRAREAGRAPGNGPDVIDGESTR